MTISRDDGSSLFRKWKSESLRIVVLGNGNGFVVSLLGIVMEVEDDRIAIARENTPAGTGGAHIVIDLNMATQWDYSDIREAPRDVREGQWAMIIKGALALHLPTSLWVFQEIDTSS